MFLFIDTTQDKNLTVALYTQAGAQNILKTVPISRTESEILLPTIDAVLSEGDIKKPAGIVVVRGAHGRFSAIRTGVVCANALAFAWNVPVSGVVHGESIQFAVQGMAHSTGFGQPVVSVYDREPNIT